MNFHGLSDVHPEDCYCRESDRFTEDYRRNVIKENEYILCSSFDASDLVFSIECGLSASRNFQPAIRILNNLDKTKISFSVGEWNNFIGHLRNIVEEYFGADSQQENIFVDLNTDEMIKLQTSSFMGSKIVKVTSTAQLPSTTMYLSEASVKQILKISGLILKHRIELLLNLKFITFYNNFLETVNKLLIQSNYELNPENIIKALCDTLTDNGESYCLRECWFYYKTKMLDDLDRYVTTN